MEKSVTNLDDDVEDTMSSVYTAWRKYSFSEWFFLNLFELLLIFRVVNILNK